MSHKISRRSAIRQLAPGGIVCPVCLTLGAKAGFAAARGELKAYYGLYAQRIIALMKNPPGKGWDGVWVAESSQPLPPSGKKPRP